MFGIGQLLHNAGDEQGIVLIRQAMALDPFFPTYIYIPVADYHFHRGEYTEALAAARKIDIPGFSLGSQVFLAGIYARLGRQSEAQSAVEELLRLDPAFTIERFIELFRKFDYRDDSIRHWAAALRKAGLPE